MFQRTVLGTHLNAEKLDSRDLGPERNKDVFQVLFLIPSSVGSRTSKEAKELQTVRRKDKGGQRYCTVCTERANMHSSSAPRLSDQTTGGVTHIMSQSRKSRGQIGPNRKSEISKK